MKAMMEELNILPTVTLPFIPSPQGRGKKNNPLSPLWERVGVRGIS
jgi:hypothetical protein